ncbi:30S ribosomal protein S4 [Micromonospora sp. NPDC049679]|uniref:30S ribosomal protein S4 n=1 Tax=Micromonospora sp. NPDC049679 TaxID=3155920 RepID=UPI0033EA11BC
MVSRSRLRLSRLFGIRLRPRLSWYLHRRQRPTGVRRRVRGQETVYRLRLREKRLLREQYDLRERQLRRVLQQAGRQDGQITDRLTDHLEQRLDALVWRAGFAATVNQARRLINHNSFTVDGTKVNRPSYHVQPGQIVAVRRARQEKLPFLLAAELSAARGAPPPYLEVHPAELRATLTHEPRKDEVPVLRDHEFLISSTRR